MAKQQVNFDEWGWPEFAETDKSIKPKSQKVNEVLNRPPIKKKPNTKYFTVEDLDKLKADAYQEGFVKGEKAGLIKGNKTGIKQGFIAGKEKGITEGEKEIKIQINSLLNIMKELISPMENIQQGIVKEVLDTVMLIGEKIARVELEKPAKFQIFIKSVLEAIPYNVRTIKIYLNNDDLKLIEKVNFAEHLEKCTLVSDKLIERGGCRVTAENTYLDATFNTRFKNIITEIWQEYFEIEDNTNISKNQNSVSKK